MTGLLSTKQSFHMFGDVINTQTADLRFCNVQPNLFCKRKKKILQDKQDMMKNIISYLNQHCE